MRARASMRMNHIHMKHMRLTEGDLVLSAGCNLLGTPWALMVSSQVVEWHSTPRMSIVLGVRRVMLPCSILFTTACTSQSVAHDIHSPLLRLRP